MAGDWSEMPFSEAVVVNPRVRLNRGEDFPFVDMAAVSASSRWAFANEIRTFNGGGSRFEAGDTLMARITPCLENGKIARFCGEQSQFAHGSTEFIVIRGRDEVTDTAYAYYLTKWNEVSGYAISQMTGTSGRQRVPTAALDHLVVPVPPLSEQRAISHILGTLDDKIELNRRMSETLEAMAQALFKSWFVDFEPVRAKAEGRVTASTFAFSNLFPTEFEMSALGEIPRGWTVQRINDVAERVAMGPFGSSIKVATFVPHGIPVISGQHLWGVTLLDSEFNYVTEAHADKLRRSNVQRGDVVFTHAGSIGQVAMIPATSRHERYVLSQRQFYLRCNTSEMLPLYVTLYFKTPDGQHRLLANKSQVGVPSIAQPVSYLRNLDIVVPPIETLRYFDTIAGEWLARSASAMCESASLATLRDTLLPKLISGELQLRDAGRFAKEVAQ